MSQKEQLLILADFYKLHPIEVIRQLIENKHRDVITLNSQLPNSLRSHVRPNSK